MLLTKIFADHPNTWQLYFQDSATPIMEGIVNLHNDLMFFLIVIAIFVIWMLTRTLMLYIKSNNPIASNIVHGTAIEIAWTVTPSLILMMVAIPSFALLYSMDEMVDPSLTLKVIGHQWYWSYEYCDYIDSGYISNNKLFMLKSLNYDSYMVPEEDLELGQLRLLEVDNRVLLPVESHIRAIVTAADVIHSWAIPSLGVKCDAIPGRLNQIGMFIKREGVYYGQCSEICGVNHGFMPIVIEAVNPKNYINWIKAKCTV
uniref:Cytochrome c oxidase subunit 2 n=1 Tax=Cyanophora paradoxa TaxID=2762 RepID=E9P1C1_CYAPA|nr:cytochrome c oxidase subunit 2 [Cyanophora paradoxa]ADW79173.1 cytochrome c oxidase subunit 2 [Cyanophora paradoxa]